jgi:cytochrome c oxidase assembly protein Cox11
MRFSMLYPSGSTVLNGNFVFDLHSICQECNPAIKWDLPVKITINNGHYKYKDMDAVDIVMLTFIFYTVHEKRMY